MGGRLRMAHRRMESPDREENDESYVGEYFNGG